jgi:hypothetical protein
MAQRSQLCADDGQLGPPLAFLHFRFEEEQGEAVLYCYEIQVDQAAQVGTGLVLKDVGRSLCTVSACGLACMHVCQQYVWQTGQLVADLPG